MKSKKKVLIAALAVSIAGFAIFLILFLLSSGKSDIKQMREKMAAVEASWLDESDVEFCYSLYKSADESGKKLIAFRDMKIYGEFRIYDVAYESERDVLLVYMAEDGGNVLKYIKYGTTSERAAAISDYIRQLDSDYNSLLAQAEKSKSDF